MSYEKLMDVLKRLQDGDKATGRPSNEDQGKEVTEKTIQNKEAGINPDKK